MNQKIIDTKVFRLRENFLLEETKWAKKCLLALHPELNEESIEDPDFALNLSENNGYSLGLTQGSETCLWRTYFLKGQEALAEFSVQSDGRVDGEGRLHFSINYSLPNTKGNL